jgi:hypothetical protein
LSTQLPAFQAATTPIGTAITTAKINVSTIRESVGSMRWAMSCVTGRLVKIEVPRSPWITRNDHSAKRTR